MNRTEMLRNLPVPLSIMSWAVVLLVIFSSFILVTVPPAGPPTGSFLMLGSFGFAVAISRAVGDQRRPARDQRMFQNIVEASDSGDHVVVITGGNHVQNVASHAAASSIEYDAYCRSSIADITNKSH